MILTKLSTASECLPTPHRQSLLTPRAAFGFFFGGLCQLIAGVLEYSRKNTFATVAFVSYGGFWMAVALNGTLVAAGVYPTSVKGEEMMVS